MSNEAKKPLSLSKGKLELKKTVETGQVRQTFSHGRTKVVQVERKRKRQFEMGADGKVQAVSSKASGQISKSLQNIQTDINQEKIQNEETAQRIRVLQQAKQEQEDAQKVTEIISEKPVPTSEDIKKEITEETKGNLSTKVDNLKETVSLDEKSIDQIIPPPENLKDKKDSPKIDTKEKPKDYIEDEDDELKGRKQNKLSPKPSLVPRTEKRRRTGKLTISAALEGEDDQERGRSIAALRRAREKERRQMIQQNSSVTTEKIIREVTLPETITVQELSNRMAERSGNVIKALMNMGVIAKTHEILDADTAELVAQEFGHKVKRIKDDDILEGLSLGNNLASATKEPRPPIVTIMGHVDHGKTSLLDALRETNIVSGEAGGITQHIGAYQIRHQNDSKITFIDTPGHEAFTSMRARGARITDIVILVVAADDGIMPQTIEAIKHTQAAKVPFIIAVNKIDKPESNSIKIKQDLLNHEIVVEEMGGETLCVEVSASKKINLNGLLEAIQLQAELLDLKAPKECNAEGVVIESKVEKGKGSVSTILVKRGTLKTGDIFVAGAEWGRVRALVNDQGVKVKSAQPSSPVEVLGFSGTPQAGDEFVVTQDETKAKEVAEFRARKIKNQSSIPASNNMEQMFAQISEGETEKVPLLIKADAHGSSEAIRATLENIKSEKIGINIIHCGVGPINESDITLAIASNAMIIGFNVRANRQAKENADKENIEIRYYSIIYNVADDVKNLLLGRLKPQYKENFLGYAEILEVFYISKTGRVAGCKVTEGIIKKGCKVRLLRDDVVIHEGDLSQLKRFKDDVKEVRDGNECGAAFTNYQDLQVKDRIECFELEQIDSKL